MSCVIHSGDTRVFAELGHLKMCAWPCLCTTNTDKKLNMTASHGLWASWLFWPQRLQSSWSTDMLVPFFLVQHYECPATPFREFCKELTSYLRQLRIHSNWPLLFLTLKSPSSRQEPIWKTPHKGLWGFVVNSRSLRFLPELSSSFSPSK